jgi:chromosome segregation ATPase
VSDQSSDIGRGLFGYRRSSVNQAISDRDIMLRQAENRAREADARSAEMEERMSALHQQVTEQQLRVAEREREMTEQVAGITQRMQEVHARLAERDQEMAARDQHIVELRAHIDRLVQQQMEAPPRPDAPSQSMTVSEEVGRLLKAAEESATRIVEQARAATARNSADAERQWRELQTSLARFAGWRDRVEPQMADLHIRMGELRSRITEIPDRVRAAFAPLAEASAATEAGLLALTGDLAPPLLSAPSRSDEHEAGNDEPAPGYGFTEAPDSRSSAQ